MTRGALAGLVLLSPLAAAQEQIIDAAAVAVLEAAAADCLAAEADEATVSITATCAGGGGTGTLPRRATDPVGLISITCPDSSNLTLRVDYAESATCGDYLRALAVRDAPATK